jgi:hypothetical protein
LGRFTLRGRAQRDGKLLTVTRLCTFDGQRALTNATGFFFERRERLFLFISRHVIIDNPGKHFPDGIEIELHVDPANMATSTGFSIPLHRNAESASRQGLGKVGEIDVAIIEIERGAQVESLGATSTGKSVGFAFVIRILFVADTEGSACQALASELVRLLTHPADPATIGQ